MRAFFASANALDVAAVAKIYEIKGRPAHNPIIVHVADVAMARRCVSDWPPAADRLSASFWPGPLTLVLRKSREIPGVVAPFQHHQLRLGRVVLAQLAWTAERPDFVMRFEFRVSSFESGTRHFQAVKSRLQ